ncbi:late nodulin [Medicago truncatula]|uniref:Late nodulin n=2 Tax=Medicago truncatula TaxID=3880 RepID=G7LA43_MEDTR|nr:late nodulin [Medicago truncatula]
MQRGKNIAQIVKFFYVIVISLFLILVAMNGGYLFECTTDYDCRDVWYCSDTQVAKCYVRSRFLSKGKCLCVK